MATKRQLAALKKAQAALAAKKSKRAAAGRKGARTRARK